MRTSRSIDLTDLVGKIKQLNDGERTMKSARKLILVVFAFLAPVSSAYAQSQHEQLNQMVQQLQKAPSDTALREKIINLAAGIKPASLVPTAAERLEGRAQYAFKNAKSEAEILDAAREYLKAVEAAPWVAGYYFDLCTILEKANRPAEAIRACKLYLIAAPAAPDAGDVRKRVAGLEYAVERLRGNVTRRHECVNMSDIYGTGDKVALIGATKISVKLISSLYAGVWRNQLLIADMTTFPQMNATQRYELTPIDTTLQLEDRVQGTPYYRLTIASDGRITFGGHGSTQAEIATSIAELHQLRNKQMNDCLIATKGGKFFVLLGQGGSLRPNDGAAVNGGLFFESDCKGNLLGEKPGWFPVGLDPHPETPGVNRQQSYWYAGSFSPASADACRQASNDGLGWLAP